MLRRTFACLILLGLLTTYLSTFAASAAPAPKKNAPQRNSKLAPDFDSAANPNDFVRVIIQTNGRPTAAHDSAVAAKGGAKGRTFDALDALTAVVPKGSLAELAARDDVAYISPVRARNDFRGRWGTDDLSCLSRYDGLMFVHVEAEGLAERRQQMLFVQLRVALHRLLVLYTLGNVAQLLNRFLLQLMIGVCHATLRNRTLYHIVRRLNASATPFMQ